VLRNMLKQMNKWFILKSSSISLIFFVLGLATIFAYGQERGTIRGLITDAETGEPLIGVNIVVEGTYLGASTDEDGFFVIQDVKPGEYSLEISYIGYKIVKRTGVKVRAGETVTVNLKMEPTALALGQEIVVVGEKPLMELDETGTKRTISSEDITQKILEDAKAIVKTQVGIVEQDDEIHIRGSRTYEAQYMLDGISVQDPLSGMKKWRLSLAVFARNMGRLPLESSM